jgi:hypothetical protein
MHPRKERNNALELRHNVGQGAMESLWSRLSYMGAITCYDNGIPIFYCIIVNTWCFEHRGQCFFKAEGNVTPYFPRRL